MKLSVLLPMGITPKEKTAISSYYGEAKGCSSVVGFLVFT